MQYGIWMCTKSTSHQVTRDTYKSEYYTFGTCMNKLYVWNIAHHMKCFPNEDCLFTWQTNPSFLVHTWYQMLCEVFTWQTGPGFLCTFDIQCYVRCSPDKLVHELGETLHSKIRGHDPILQGLTEFSQISHSTWHMDNPMHTTQSRFRHNHNTWTGWFYTGEL